MYVSYKLNTLLSSDDIHKCATSIGFYPDNAGSWNYTAAASRGGRGSQNNRNFGFENLYGNSNGYVFTSATVAGAGSPVTAGSAIGTPFTTLYTNHYPAYGTELYTPPEVANFGMYQRQKIVSGFIGTTPWTSLLTVANARVLAKSYYDNNTNGTADGAPKVWYITAQIYLKHLHSFFENLPLIRSGYIRMILNINNASVTISSATVAATGTTITDATPAGQVITQTALTLSQGTVPFMVASADPNCGLYEKTANGISYIIKSAICSLTTSDGYVSQTFTHPLTSTRLYVPVYSMSPQAEIAYIGQGVKTVTYTDLFYYRVSNIASGSTINNLITNGLVNIQNVIIVPTYTSGGNGGVGYAPYQSVFASEPATTSPLACIGNFNLQIAGINSFQIAEQYDFSQFEDEFQHQHSLNAGLINGLTSGQVNFWSWSNNYRYYTVNASRRLPQEDVVPKSVLMLGTNLCERECEYHVFIECLRSIRLSISTSELVV